MPALPPIHLYDENGAMFENKTARKNLIGCVSKLRVGLKKIAKTSIIRLPNIELRALRKCEVCLVFTRGVLVYTSAYPAICQWSWSYVTSVWSPGEGTVCTPPSPYVVVTWCLIKEKRQYESCHVGLAVQLYVAIVSGIGSRRARGQGLSLACIVPLSLRDLSVPRIRGVMCWMTQFQMYGRNKWKLCA